MPPENITPAEQAIIDQLTKLNSSGGDRKTKQDANDAKRAAQKNFQALRDNGLALVGLTAGMFSLTSMIGNQLKMNSDLAQALGQTGSALRGVESATNRFIRGQQGTEQMIKVFSDAVEMGMTNFSDRTLQFGSQLKVLGIQNKTAFKLMRANTQGLGVSETASLTLANELFSTAAANQDSMAGLIDAINSMKDAMISTTVELGPKAAMNAQKIAAMMAQGNSELQDSSARFVKSFLAGSDGYMKAAKLGVQFTGQESTGEMARKFEAILGRIQGLQAGKQGAGSQFFFDAMEKSFGLSREDFNLQTQIGTSINSLAQGNIEQLSRQSAGINLQQIIWEATEPFQTRLLAVTEEFAVTIKDILNKVTDFSTTLGQNLVPIMSGVFALIGLVGLGGLLAPIRMMWGAVKGFGFVFGKIFKSLDKLGTKLASAIFGVKSAVMKSTGKTVFGAAAQGAVKKGTATAVQKGFLKGLVKKIPIIGAVAGAAFAVSRAMKGDMVGASMELASGLASIVPGVGTAVSLGFDAGLLARDLKKQSEEGGGASDASRAHTAAIQELIDVSKEGNEQRAEQTEMMNGEGGHQPITAGAGL